MSRHTPWAIAAALLVAACGSKIDPRQESADAGRCTIPSPVTYTKHIAPLMARYCASCHARDVTGSARQGAPPTANYDTYASTSAGADKAWGRLKDASMPPSPPKMTSCEVKIFRAWIDTGKKEK